MQACLNATPVNNYPLYSVHCHTVTSEINVQVLILSDSVPNVIIIIIIIIIIITNV
jgi:hypothetical protein